MKKAAEDEAAAIRKAELFQPLPEPKPLCWNFSTKGHCAHPDCRFSHDLETPDETATPPESDCRTADKLYWLQQMPGDPMEYHLLTGTLEANGYRMATSSEEQARASLLWCGVSSTRAVVGEQCTLNRLGGGTRLTHKDRLVTSLRKGAQRKLAPLTFKLPAERAALFDHCAVDECTWIVKRARSGRGRGIYMTTSGRSITEQDDCVVCQYIERPLLVNGHKHDLRLFALVTSIEPLRAYLHTGGYVRFAARKFRYVLGNTAAPG